MTDKTEYLLIPNRRIRWSLRMKSSCNKAELRRMHQRSSEERALDKGSIHILQDTKDQAFVIKESNSQLEHGPLEAGKAIPGFATRHHTLGFSVISPVSEMCCDSHGDHASPSRKLMHSEYTNGTRKGEGLSMGQAQSQLMNSKEGQIDSRHNIDGLRQFHAICSSKGGMDRQDIVDGNVLKTKLDDMNKEGGVISSLGKRPREIFEAHTVAGSTTGILVGKGFGVQAWRNSTQSLLWLQRWLPDCQNGRFTVAALFEGLEYGLSVLARGNKSNLNGINEQAMDHICESSVKAIPSAAAMAIAGKAAGWFHFG
eukprot:c53291_g1_i1 orf=373-1311(-)